MSGTAINVTDQIKSLGVFIDSRLSFDKQVSSGFRTELPSSYAPSLTSVYMVRLLTTSLDHAFRFQQCVVDHV